jgi:uncharacterized protein YjdB
MNKERFNTILIIIIAIIIGLIAYVLLRGNKTKVSSVILSNKTISIFVGENKKLDVSIIPDDANDKSLIWTSSNTNVANVDDGMVTGISEGDAIITVKSSDSDVSDSCMVRVIKNEATELAILDTNVELRINEEKTLNVTIDPIEFYDLITWTSSDERIATVDNKGKVTGISNGKTTIKAIYGDKEAICDVKVVIPVNTLNIDSEITLGVGETKIINPVITPEEASNQELFWETSDNEIVSVDNGNIKGLKVGTAKVTATIDSKKATVLVRVIIPVDNITLNKDKISLKVGENTTLKATITPSDATNKEIVWTSSNTSVATVSDGKVKTIKSGVATITATVSGKTAKTTISVYNSSITDNSKYYSGYSNVVTYNSDTLKYRILRTGKDYYTLIWVLDSNKQFNSALPKLGTRYKAEYILSSEIKKYNYQNKGLVATNGSAFWDKWGEYPTTQFIINKGNIVRNFKKNETYPWSYGSVGITKDGLLKLYHGFNASTYEENANKRQKMLDDGIRNNFTVFNELLSPEGKLLNSTIKVKYTALCQVDENNFIIYSGESLTFGETGKRFKDKFNCRVGYRFDGGGSTTLFYKTGSMSTPTSIRSGRDLPDMMYFVEQ